MPDKPRHPRHRDVAVADDLAVDDHEIVEIRGFKLSEAVRLPAYPATKRFLEHLGRELDERPAEPVLFNGSPGADGRD